MSTGTTAASLAGSKVMGKSILGQDDGYFLSPRNPLATLDQQWLDATAMRLWAREDVKAAVARARASFAVVTDHLESPQTMALLDAYAPSFGFRSLQLGVNSDADHPRVMRIYTPAARWLGNAVPESRWGQENPDNIYRIIPIASGGRYAVHGRRLSNPTEHVSYALVADTNTSITVGMLEQDQIESMPDGSFTILLDGDPAEGRPNHIRTSEDARYLFIRDTMSDWSQLPNLLRVERLNPPARAPLSDDELAQRAMRVMQMGVAPAYYWNRLVRNHPMGELATPSLTGANGGLLTQLSTHGWFRLEEGQAVVIRVDGLASTYQSIVLYDFWGRSLEYRDHLTSLNNGHMRPDADGAYTFVISREDPGFANWLDPLDLNEFCVGYRWQGLPARISASPGVSARIVSRDAIPAVASDAAVRIDTSARREQLARRRLDHDRRYLED